MQALRRSHWGDALAGVSVAFCVTWLCTFIGGFTISIDLAPTRIDPEIGNAYQARTRFNRNPLFQLADDSATARFRAPRLTEDGQVLGPGRQLHETLRKAGSAGFALNGDVLRFARTAGGDPRSNGHRYRVVAAVQPSPLFTALAVLAGLSLWHRRVVRRADVTLQPHRRTATVGLAAAAAVAACGLLARHPLVPELSAGLLALLLVCIYLLARDDAANTLGVGLRALVAEATNRYAPATFACLLFGVAASGWYASLWWTQPPDPNNTDVLAVALWRAGELVAPPGTVQAASYPYLQMQLPAVMAFLQRTFALPLEYSHQIFSGVFAAIAVSAMALVTLKVSGARGYLASVSAVLAFAVFAQSWLTKLNVGYPILLASPNFLLGTWALAAALMVWAGWLTATCRRRAVWVYPALAGLIFDLHSTYGLIVIGILLTGEALVALCAQERVSALRRLLPCVVAFVLGALPSIVSLVEFAHVAPAMISPAQDWWTLMAFRKAFHIFLWGSESGIQPGLALIALTWTSITLALRPFLPREQTLRLTATLLASAAFCTAAYAVFAVVPTPQLVGLVLTRAAILPLCVLPALAVAHVVLCLRAWAADRAPLAAVRLALAAVAAAVLALPGTGGDHAQLAVLTSGAWLLSAALPWLRAAAAVPAIYVRNYLQAIPSAVVASVSVIALATPVLLLPAKWQATLASMSPTPGRSWTSVTDFVRAHVPHDQMVLMPPYPYAMVSSRHVNPADYSQLGISVYAQWLVPLEFQNLKALYDLDLRQFTPSTMPSYLNAQGGILCLVERGYVALTSSEARLRQLRTLYPTLHYVVGLRPAVTPMQWSCGPAAAQLLSLPQVFANDIYVVYRLPD